jgi:hypothetical protein
LPLRDVGTADLFHDGRDDRLRFVEDERVRELRLRFAARIENFGLSFGGLGARPLVKRSKLNKTGAM